MKVVRGLEDRWEDLSDELAVRYSQKEEIQRLYQNDHQRMEALINHYVRHKPTCSWKEVASALEEMELPQLAEVVTTKYGTWRKYCNTEIRVFCSLPVC